MRKSERADSSKSTYSYKGIIVEVQNENELCSVDCDIGVNENKLSETQ